MAAYPARRECLPRGLSIKRTVSNVDRASIVYRNCSPKLSSTPPRSAHPVTILHGFLSRTRHLRKLSTGSREAKLLLVRQRTDRGIHYGPDSSDVIPVEDPRCDRCDIRQSYPRIVYTSCASVHKGLGLDFVSIHCVVLPWIDSSVIPSNSALSRPRLCLNIILYEHQS